jgi:hypothetical protein
MLQERSEDISDPSAYSDQTAFSGARESFASDNLDFDNAVGGVGVGVGGSGVLLAESMRMLRVAVEGLTTVAAAGELGETPEQVLADMVHELRIVETRLAGVRLTALPVIETGGLWAQSGARSFPAWLAREDDIYRGQADRETRQATALRDHLPSTRQALLAGQVGLEQMNVIAGVANTPDRKAELAHVSERNTTRGWRQLSGEEYLLHFAGEFNLTAFKRIAAHFAHVADPEADERGHRQATEREHLQLSPTWGGWLITAGEYAVLVSGYHRPTQIPNYRPLTPPHVQHLGIGAEDDAGDFTVTREFT